MRLVGLCFAVACVITSCVPWTVVPIEDEPQQDASLDAAAYVDSVWASRLLPAVQENAVDLAQAQALHTEGRGDYFLVKGTARVLSLDTTSRSGKLLVDVEPYDGTTDAALLVGPVILGTALRDGAGFIQFTDFLNQLQYADVANELNRRVVEEVVGSLDMASLAGRVISFGGAWKASGSGTPEIVPVEVTVE